ncbi:hypothetical protein B0O80DRAFT_448477 [Mortierella sp. GBAus27b]|nr:hypothetical protein B0O80DRAFT_448477 [Mortierella sp. GBAus27b]
MFDIPELDDLICWHLGRRDLIRCAQVNKRWHDIVIPFLWGDFTFLEHCKTKAAFHKLVEEDFLHEQRQQRTQNSGRDTGQHTQPPQSPLSPSLTKYGHFIRKTPDPKELLSYFRHSPHILRFMALTPGDIRYPTPNELLRHFYKRCHGPIQVDSMTLTHEDFTGDLWKTITEDVVFRVQHLQIGMYQRRKTDAKVDSQMLECLLHRLSTTLERLTFQVDIDFRKSERLMTDTNRWTLLKELRILKGYATTESFWPWLWTRCHYVEKLEVASIDDSDTRTLTSTMLTCMPNLDAFHLGYHRGTQKLNDEQIATLLSGSNNGWRELKVSDNMEFGRSALKALTLHFLTLQELIVDGCHGFTGENLVQVLSSCPNLRSLVAIDDRKYSRVVVFTHIEYNVFIDQDLNTGTLRTWSCEASLKVLKVMIGGIPRPDIQYADIEETYHGQGREIQEVVYERLARLTNLETLWLGHDPVMSDDIQYYHHIRFQYDCLAMSLDSGLDKLSRLKALTELSVTHMKKNTKIKDIQWMVENWPRLGVIYGLVREIYEDDTYAIRWLEDHFPKITLRCTEYNHY